jgi:hypothetical protein
MGLSFWCRLVVGHWPQDTFTNWLLFQEMIFGMATVSDCYEVSRMHPTILSQFLHPEAQIECIKREKPYKKL